MHALLSTMLRDGVEEGLLLVNPCHKTVLPQAPRYGAVYLSSAQLQTLLDAVDLIYRCLVFTTAGTGMRWGELTGLRRDRLDLPGRRLQIDQTVVDLNGQLSVGQPKTRGSRRSVSLPQPVVQALYARLAGSSSELLFTSPEGQALRRSNWYSRTVDPGGPRVRRVPPPRFHDLTSRC